MKALRSSPLPARGVTLVETIVSVGVLAVVAPLALAAMIRAGDSGSAARAETRAPAIVEACLAEIDLARHGSPEHLSSLEPGQPFGGTTVLCLAFDRAGTLLGKVEGDAYEGGIPHVGDGDAVYLATLASEPDTTRGDGTPLLKLTIGIEYPAVARQAKRSRMEFLTKLP